MSAFERRLEIVEQLKKANKVNVEKLAKQFFVCESTIRRDLDRIVREGMAKRTYGGAVLLDNSTSDLPMLIRERENTEIKNAIARRAVEFIRDGDTIFMDTSSTVMALVPLLDKFTGLTIVTNGLKTAYLLNTYNEITTHCTGGRLRQHNMALVGNSACRRIKEINANIAFISCRGINMDKGVTEASEEEAEVKRAMLFSSERTFLLCDSKKFGRVLTYHICALTSLNTLISDVEPPAELYNVLKEIGVDIVIASPQAK